MKLFDQHYRLCAVIRARMGKPGDEPKMQEEWGAPFFSCFANKYTDFTLLQTIKILSDDIPAFIANRNIKMQAFARCA